MISPDIMSCIMAHLIWLAAGLANFAEIDLVLARAGLPAKGKRKSSRMFQRFYDLPPLRSTRPDQGGPVSSFFP